MAMISMPDADWSALQDEALELLRDLVRLPTIGPNETNATTPGTGFVAVGEKVADNAIREKLTAAGIDSVIYEHAEGRGNLIARLKGDQSKKPVLLLGHLDVAGVKPAEWTKAQPFNADIVDGRLYGRGAADMKYLVAMHVMALLIAKRRGIPLKRDLILAAVADEEEGSREGMLFLLDRHWEEIQAEFSFNEGFSGHPVLGRDRKTVIWVGLEAIEKRIFVAQIDAAGHSGHASSEQPDNSIYLLSAALERLRRHPRPMVLNPASERYARAIRARFGEDPRDSHVPEIMASFHDTVVPTGLTGGTDVSVLPGQATARITCRLLPTTDTYEFMAWMKTVVEVPGVTVTFPSKTKTARLSPAPSAFENDLVTAYTAAVTRYFGPHVPVIPTQGIGTTDSFHLRERGVAAYGVWPLVDTERENMHGNDESIPVASFREGLRMYVEMLFDLAT